MHAGHVVHARAYSCVFACAGDHDLASLIIYMPILRRLEISIPVVKQIPQSTHSDAEIAANYTSRH